MAFAEDYIEVPDRIRIFLDKYPDGSLQLDPPTFVEIDGKTWVWARAYAYRTPDDPRPGIGTAWEPVPGTSTFTRGSELQNLETSAWGRAIAALGIGLKRGIASAHEVRMAREKQVDAGPWKRTSVTVDGVLLDELDAFTQPDVKPGGSYSYASTKKATTKQLGLLHARLSALMPSSTVEERAEMVRSTLGQPELESTKELSAGDVSALIDVVQELLDAKLDTESEAI